MNFLKKYWPSILPVLTLVGTALAPAIQAAIAAHPNVAVALSAAYAILAHILPSPKQ